MSKKPNKKVKKEVERKESASMKGAFWFFGSGCLAEVYLLILRKYFINGTLEQVVNLCAEALDEAGFFTPAAV